MQLKHTERVLLRLDAKVAEQRMRLFKKSLLEIASWTYAQDAALQLRKTKPRRNTTRT